MTAFLADENFNNDILRGVLRRLPTFDVVRVQDTSLSGAPDNEVLAWAAAKKRIVLTHDVKTMSRYAYDRIEKGQAMPGVFEVNRAVPIVVAIDELILVAECGLDGDWEGQVRYLPML